MPQLQAPILGLAALYQQPTVRSIYEELDDHQFEHFVKHVFEQAGYIAEDTAGRYGDGLDLKLSIGSAHAPSLYAGVSIKHFRPIDTSQVSEPARPPVLVQVQHVRDLKGALAEQGGIAGYLVTTSTLNDAALTRARQEPHIWPIDGEHLVRYINYVRGSRAAEAEDTEPDVRLRTNPLAPIPAEVLLAADDIIRRPPQQTTVLAVANNKGGVGKTTTALNLACGLAATGKQVLLVDMDPQANLTKVLPTQAPSAAAFHIGDYFRRTRTLPALIRQTQFKGLWLIPSDNGLIFSDSGIAAGPGAELRFVRDLHAPEVVPPPILQAHGFDWIILDTGPSMGLFTRAAVAAAHYVLMPISPSVFTDLGANLLVNTVRAMSALVGEQITILGSLVTQWKDDPLHQNLLRLAIPNLEGTGLRLFQTKIPLDKANIENAYQEAGSGQPKSLFSHHKRSKVALGYAAAVAEVLSHVVTGRDS